MNTIKFNLIPGSSSEKGFSMYESVQTGILKLLIYKKLEKDDLDYIISQVDLEKPSGVILFFNQVSQQDIVSMSQIIFGSEVDYPVVVLGPKSLEDNFYFDMPFGFSLIHDYEHIEHGVFGALQIIFGPLSNQMVEETAEEWEGDFVAYEDQ